MSYSFTDIKKTYNGQIVLDNLSLDFNDTGIYLLKGDSGAGKTTLLKLLSGIEKLDTGTHLSIRSTSISFQDNRLFPWLTALENILIVHENPKDNHLLALAKEKLALLGFSEDDMNKRPDELSGGMKQRVSLLRAILYPTEVLLLDEPTKEMDSLLVKKICEMLKDEARERLVILSSHDDLSMYIEFDGTIIIPKIS